MLCLSFSVDAHRYALPARHIEAVLPLVALRPVPQAPAWVAGLMRYHGDAVPVLDLGLLAGGAPCALLLSTRIILVQIPSTRGRIGLRVERATDTMVLPDAALHEPAIGVPEAPFLGRLAEHDGDLVQLVEPDGLLDDAVRALLRAADEPGPGATRSPPAETLP